MADGKLRSMPSTWMIAAGVFVVALILLLLFGHGFLGALLWALVLAAAVAAFFLLARQSSTAAGPGTSPAGSTTTPAGGGGATGQRDAGTRVDRTGGRDEPSATRGSGHNEPRPVTSDPPTAERNPAGTPAPASSPEPAASKPAAPDAPSSTGSEPVRLDAPREGGPDDLKKIKGIGPKLEGELNSMGIYHLDQIASWSDDEVAWMDENLVEFRGRVSRDDWVGQAKVLTSGGETGFSHRSEGSGAGD